MNNAAYSIWLEEAALELSNKGNTQVEFTGFDVSGALFPEAAKPGFEFVVWDMNQPFPEKYIGQFDVVHVRFIVVALTLDKMRTFLENMAGLLSNLLS